MSRALHGFEDLRTRPPEPPELPPKPCCTKCGAVLRHGNTGTLCAPCGRPAGLELPGWALELAERADPAQLTLLGKLLRSQLQVANPDAEPEPDAPLCACGCGRRTLRLLQSHNGKPERTGPYQRFVRNHHNNMYKRKEVTTPE